MYRSPLTGQNPPQGMLRIIVVPVNGTDLVNFRRKTLKNQPGICCKKIWKTWKSQGNLLLGLAENPVNEVQPSLSWRRVLSLLLHNISVHILCEIASMCYCYWLLVVYGLQIQVAAQHWHWHSLSCHRTFTVVATECNCHCNYKHEACL